ncbi:MAG: hypothetical protein H6831_16770 [Planctomycetes bacterium]|nr:hypothetical protein [Planctomycetota bacterium]MCB9906056.1 hypothetical protein [Planctomycetota bacterium]
MKRVVLVNPAGPRNVGMALRVADNFGPCELVLVKPSRPALLLHPEFEQMSHGVDEIAGKLRVVDTLAEALEGTTWAVGFTARVRGDVVRAEWNELRGGLVERTDDPEELVALVFGSEEFGLSADDAALCQELVHIRTSADHTSLNLAVCVGVVLQGLYTGTEVHRPEPGGHPLKGEERAFLIANLRHAFSDNVARSDEAKRLIVRSIDRVFGRSQLSTSDARAWHMMARSLGSKKVPADFGLNPSPSKKVTSDD